MSKENLPEEQTPQTEETPVENETAEAASPAEPADSQQESGTEAPAAEAPAPAETGDEDETDSQPPVKKKKERRRSDTRKLRYGAMATGLSVIVIAGIVLFNVIMGILADRYPLSFDLSEDKTFSLSEQGIAVAESLQKEVQITVFADESMFESPWFGNELDTIFRQFYQMSREFGSRSGGKVSVSYIDLTANPTLDSRYSQYDLSTGDILFESGSRSQLISYTDLYDQATSNSTLTGYTVTSLVEQKLASCINTVASDHQTVITMLTGHGEDTNAISMLQDLYELNGYTVETVDFTTTTDIHEDSQALILVGPTRDFTEEERNRLQEWLSNDGDLQRNLFLFCDMTAKLPVLYGFLEGDYGIQVTDNVIQETYSGNLYRDYYQYMLECAIGSIQSSDLTDAVADQRILLPYPRQLVTTRDSDISQDNPSNTSLVTFGNTAKLMPLADDENTQVELIDADSYPVTAVAYAERQGIINGSETVSSHVFVSGSTYMLYYLETSGYQNDAFLISALNAVTGMEGPAITGRSLDTEMLSHSDLTAQIVGLGIFTIGLPAVMLVISLVVFIRRRHL